MFRALLRPGLPLTLTPLLHVSLTKDRSDSIAPLVIDPSGLHIQLNF